MFDDVKPFQLVTIAIFLIGAVVGVMIFAFGGSPGGDKGGGPKVVVWGTVNQTTFNNVLTDINGPTGSFINVTYVQKNPDTFNQDLLEAIASGVGPDVALLSIENIFSQRDRFMPIPFSSYDERTFRDSFIQQAELLRVHDGYLALPFALDPLVLYWNRDIFNSKNQPNPPQYWDTVVAIVPTLSEVSTDFTITKSAISMGDFRNINHAKEILLSLIFQEGGKLTSLTYNAENKRERLVSAFGATQTPVGVSAEETALSFYTQFANPLAREYTWNRSLPTSLDSFSFGNLAMYIGLGSDASLIRSKNPNLNFDVALLPQSRKATVPATYGEMFGLAILSSSQNKSGALQAITRLTDKDFLGRYAAVSGLPPVRRDLLATPPANNAFAPVLYRSAFYANAWLDPSPVRTESLFREMVESVLAGRDSVSTIVRTAKNQLDLLIEEFNKKHE